MKDHLIRLIADSGSTKTDWALTGLADAPVILHTQGINPFHQDADTIRAILCNELLPQILGMMEHGEWKMDNKQFSTVNRQFSISFYGSGVRPELEPLMESLLREVFTSHLSLTPRIEAHSDMLGAARALCGEHEGIACILGTGANSCLYDGESIVMNTPPMGYILGDEGSGAVLGARFLNALYKGRLPQSLLQAFEQSQQLTMAQVIDRVYRQPLANRWLASLSPFIHQFINIEAVHQLVVQNFHDFISHNIVPYHRPDLPLSAVGSIAHYYRDQLAEAACHDGYTIGRILRSPLDALE